MAGLITKASIGVTLLIMFVAFTFLFLVDLGNEYDVEIGSEYNDRFGIEFDSQGVELANNVSNIVADSSQFQESGELDNQGFDSVQSPGSISATGNLINIRDVMTDFATDFNEVGFAFDPIITYSLLTIFVIGLLVSAAYIYFKVMP